MADDRGPDDQLRERESASELRARKRKKSVSDPPHWKRKKRVSNPPHWQEHIDQISSSKETYLDPDNLIDCPYSNGKASRIKPTWDMQTSCTGFALRDLVVFNIEREALHQTIVELTTRIRMSDVSALNTAVRIVYARVKNMLVTLKAEILKDLPTRAQVTKLVNNQFSEAPEDLVRIIALVKQKTAGSAVITEDKKKSATIEVELGRQQREYLETNVRNVVAKVIDDILKFKQEYKENPKLDVTHYEDVLHHTFEELSMKESFERCTFIIAGGPAAGKSHVAQNLFDFQYRADLEDFAKVNADYYKNLLLTVPTSKINSSPIDINSASMAHVESSIVGRKIKARLRSLLDSKDEHIIKSPDLMLDVVKPSEENMKIAGYGGATVILKIVTCPSHVAIKRAYDRFTTGTEKGRWVPQKEILDGHRQVSVLLPDAVAKYNVFLEIYDTDVTPGANPTLVADIATLDKQIRVHDLQKMISFMEKSKINDNARSDCQILPQLSVRQHVELFFDYMKKNISFLFCVNLTGYATVCNSAMAILDLAMFISGFKKAEIAADFVAEFISLTLVEQLSDGDVICTIHQRSQGTKLFVATFTSAGQSNRTFQVCNPAYRKQFGVFFAHLQKRLDIKKDGTL